MDNEKKEMILEIIEEFVVSPNTLFKTIEEMEEILEKIIVKKLKETGKDENFLTGEIGFIYKLTIGILPKRDGNQYPELCHWLRNIITSTGGFNGRIKKFTERINKDLEQYYPQLISISEKTEDIKKFTKIIGEDVQRIEQWLNIRSVPCPINPLPLPCYGSCPVRLGPPP